MRKSCLVLALACAWSAGLPSARADEGMWLINKPPTAKLKAPKKSLPGKSVKLDASGSKDPDGTIANYAWDLDGDGAFETDGAAKATLKHAFKAGVHHVAVRVTDDKGKRAYATRTIRVQPPVTKRGGGAAG